MIFVAVPMAANHDIHSVSFTAIPNTGVLVPGKSDNYFIRIEQSSHYLIRVPVELGKAFAEKLCAHPKVFLSRFEGFDFKWSDRHGYKRWTTKVGREFFFVLPASRLEVVLEQGYSYPRILIDGQVITANVSGGTNGNAWNDYIDRSFSTAVNLPKKSILAIAEAALRKEEVAEGMFDIPEPTYSEEELLPKIAKSFCPKAIKPGMKVLLGEGFSFLGSRGPFPLDSIGAKRSTFILGGNLYDKVRAARGKIDWLATAKLNGIELPTSCKV